MLYKIWIVLIIAFVQYISCQNPCLNNGVQVLAPAPSVSKVCICQAKFIGDTCQTNISSLNAVAQGKLGCSIHPCNVGATCEDKPDGTYQCHCPVGFGGPLCTVAVTNDPCASRPCFNGGTCTKTSNTASLCICGPNFSGPTCKLSKVGACAKNPCQRDGVCVAVGTTGYKCQCPDWTLGTNCETVFNPCSRVTCQNAGQCIRKRTTAYQCNCTATFSGDLCQQSSFLSTLTTPSFSTPSFQSTFTTSSYTTPTTTAPNTNSSCFPESTLVETMNRGSIQVSDLQRGDLVKSFDSSSNQWKYSRFVFFLHKDEQTQAEYISIKTSSSKNLKISKMHLIPKRGNQNEMEFVLAKDLKLNDVIVSEDNQNEMIVDLTKVIEHGAYAPLLESGTISVNNILASCYANTKWHGLAHLAFQPVIQLSNFFNMENTQANSENGINWYAGLLSSVLPIIPMSSSFVYV